MNVTSMYANSEVQFKVSLAQRLLAGLKTSPALIQRIIKSKIKSLHFVFCVN